MNRRPLEQTVLAFALAFSLCACRREEGAEKGSPIAVVMLPTPKTTVRAADRMGTAAPMSAQSSSLGSRRCSSPCAKATSMRRVRSLRPA